MLLNLLLTNIKILCFFFLILVVSNNLFMIPDVKKYIKLKLALAIHAGAPITLTKEIIEFPPLVVDKAIKLLSK